MRVLFIAVFILVGITFTIGVRDRRYDALLKCMSYIFRIHPLLVLVDKSGKKSLLMHDKLDDNGVAKIEQFEQVIFNCPGLDNYLVMNRANQVVNIHNDMYPRKFFTSYGFLPGAYPDKKQIDEARCVSPFLVHILVTKNKCANGRGILLLAGFNIKPFLELYKICFDAHNFLPIYTMHKLFGSKLLFHREKLYLYGMFIDHVCKYIIPLESPGNAYYRESQEQLIQKLFGTAQGNEYLKLKNEQGRLIKPVHLTPPGDFYFRPVKTATYVHENSTPVFNSIATGNLYFVEVVGRILALQLGSLQTVSGTIDLLKLPDGGVKKYIYLDNETIGNKLIQSRPIKKYLYKIYYDKVRLSGVAFVILNNPFVGNKDKVEFPCEDISNQFTDTNIFSDEPSAGMTRVCAANDLIEKKLDYLRDLKITKEILKLEISEQFPMHLFQRNPQSKGENSAAFTSRKERGFRQNQSGSISRRRGGVGQNQPASRSRGRNYSRGRG